MPMQLRESFYIDEEITILRDEAIVDAIVAKKIDLEAALNGGMLVISKVLSIDDFLQLTVSHYEVLKHNEYIQKLIRENKIPFEQFKMPLKRFQVISLKTRSILLLIDKGMMTFEKLKNLSRDVLEILTRSPLLGYEIENKKISIDDLEKMGDTSIDCLILDVLNYWLTE